MSKLNEKFLKNISNLELLKFYGDEIISLFDYEKYDLPKEQFQRQARAVVANFIEQLIEYLKLNSIPKNP